MPERAFHFTRWNTDDQFMSIGSIHYKVLVRALLRSAYQTVGTIVCKLLILDLDASG